MEQYIDVVGEPVLQVISAASAVVGHDIAFDVELPRGGDPAILVADASLAREELGWKPLYNEMEEIIASAWQWHQNEKF